MNSGPTEEEESEITCAYWTAAGRRGGPGAGGMTSELSEPGPGWQRQSELEVSMKEGEEEEEEDRTLEDFIGAEKLFNWSNESGLAHEGH